MAKTPMRKKINKRSILKPQNPSSSITSASSSSIVDYRKVALIVAAMLIVCLMVLFSFSHPWGTFGSKPQLEKLYTIEVIQKFPHDPAAFTQGLLYVENDTLYESTGLYGQSSVRKVALRTGKVEAVHKMDNSYFGEGLTLLGKRLFQVTWLKQTGFVYDINNLSKFKKFTHQMQDGWGLATDGKILFGTDGTSTLYHIDPKTLKVTEKQIVKYKGHEVHNLNELEYINDEVWANVWMTDCIARISHKDGNVLGWILLQSLREGLEAAGYRNIDVLNGIAWDKHTDRLFVTGKLWPTLFEIKVHPMKKPFEGDIERTCMPMPSVFAKT